MASTVSANGSSDAADIEKGAGVDYAHLTNASVQSYAWQDVTVTVKDRQTKKPKDILSGVSGIVYAGEYQCSRTNQVGYL
jgi:hypothetical protein